MKRIILVVVSIVLLITLFPTTVLAGDRNANGDNGSQGTGILNGKDGCRPGVQSGDYWVYIPSPLLDSFGLTDSYYHEWLGGPCCPSNISSGIGNDYPLSNQCCNGPDYAPEGPPLFGAPTGEQAPGNHCECFELRGYPWAILPF